MGRFRVIEEIRAFREGGVVGNADAALIAGRSERHVGEHEAFFDAGGVEVLFDAHPVGQLQILGDGPFVREVEISRGKPEMERPVKRERLGKAAQRVSGGSQLAIGEVRQIAQAVGAQERSRDDAGIRVLIVAGVHAGLDCVRALVPGKVVVDLEMADVSAVRKRSRAHRGKAAAVGAAVADGDRIRHERRVLRNPATPNRAVYHRYEALNVLTTVGVMTQVCERLPWVDG